jgi:hypothetical protein
MPLVCPAPTRRFAALSVMHWRFSVEQEQASSLLAQVSPPPESRTGTGKRYTPRLPVHTMDAEA